MKMVEVVVEDFGGIPGETVIDLHLHWRAGAGSERHVAVANYKQLDAMWSKSF